MNALRRLGAVLGLAVLGIAAPPAADTGSPVATGDGAFAGHLYAQLRDQPGNLFLSPASIRIALAMASAGARGETAAEMVKALQLPAGKAAHDQFGALLRSLAALAQVELPKLRPGADVEDQKDAEEQVERRRIVLRVVNRLWAQVGHPFNAGFATSLRTVYQAPLGEIDFRADPEAARGVINKWVSDATEHKIATLLPPRMLTKNTGMVITNAVYFKAHWQHPFEPLATQKDAFFVTPKKPVMAPLMHEIEHHRLSRFPGGKMVELLYGEGPLAMDVVLPDDKAGLPALEAQFASGKLAAWVAGLAPARVDVALPRWKTRASFDVVNALRALGMKLAFTFPGADFSGIDGSKLLFIGAVVHQAMVEVDEKGTEAAAATAVLAMIGSAPPSDAPVPFRADHPFLYLLRDTRSGVILFVGRLADPTAL
jgi:serpin B